jgi:hypothetical protein
LQYGQIISRNERCLEVVATENIQSPNSTQENTCAPA